MDTKSSLLYFFTCLMLNSRGKGIRKKESLASINMPAVVHSGSEVRIVCLLWPGFQRPWEWPSEEGSENNGAPHWTGRTLLNTLSGKSPGPVTLSLLLCSLMTDSWIIREVFFPSMATWSFTAHTESQSVSMCVCWSACVFLCVSVCTHVSMYVCECVCLHVCVCVCWICSCVTGRSCTIVNHTQWQEEPEMFLYKATHSLPSSARRRE